MAYEINFDERDELIARLHVELKEARAVIASMREAAGDTVRIFNRRLVSIFAPL